MGEAAQRGIEPPPVKVDDPVNPVDDGVERIARLGEGDGPAGLGVAPGFVHEVGEAHCDVGIARPQRARLAVFGQCCGEIESVRQQCVSKHCMRRRQIRCNREGLAHRLQRAVVEPRHFRNAGGVAVAGDHQDARLQHIGARIGGIGGQRAFNQRRCLVVGSRILVEIVERLGLQVEIVCRDIGCAAGFLRHALAGLLADTPGERTGNHACHFAFNREDVRQRALESLRPAGHPAVAVDQRSGDAHSFRGAADRALEQPGDAELAGDLARIFSSGAEQVGRGRRCHRQMGVAGEARADFLC